MCGCYDSRGRNVWQLLQRLQASQMCPQTYTLFLTSLEDWPRGPERWSASNYREKDIRVSEFQVFLSATSAALWSALQIVDVKERWKDWRRQNLIRTKKQRIKKWNQEEREEKAHTFPQNGFLFQRNCFLYEIRHCELSFPSMLLWSC